MIYLDNNATTEALPEVIDAVTATMKENWGNPSSSHALGRKAREALENARHVVSTTFRAASPCQITFTSSGTESINLACATLISREIRQVLVTATEHAAVLRAVERWAEGRPVILVPVNRDGQFDADFLETHVKQAKSLVSVSAANNETGVISNIQQAANICMTNGSLLHVDAVQVAGKMSFSFESLNCAAASLSAHKFHGAPGCGILYLRKHPESAISRRVPAPGHHEQGLRAGTENLPAIVGCGVAVSLLQKSLDAMPGVESLRNQLEAVLLERVPGSDVHGRDCLRLPNTTNLYFPSRNASDLVAALSRLGLAASAGAACSNGGKSSHVIKAMGYSEERANSALRLSLSCNITSKEIAVAAALMERAFHLTPATGR